MPPATTIKNYFYLSTPDFPIEIQINVLSTDKRLRREIMDCIGLEDKPSFIYKALPEISNNSNLLKRIFVTLTKPSK